VPRIQAQTDLRAGECVEKTLDLHGILYKRGDMGMKNKTEAEFRSSGLDLANDRSHLIPLSET
jgi:hypothetical protein